VGVIFYVMLTGSNLLSAKLKTKSTLHTRVYHDFAM
jgi:hypothetical protein